MVMNDQMKKVRLLALEQSNDCCSFKGCWLCFRCYQTTISRIIWRIRNSVTKGLGELANAR